MHTDFLEKGPNLPSGNILCFETVLTILRIRFDGSTCKCIGRTRGYPNSLERRHDLFKILHSVA